MDMGGHGRHSFTMLELIVALAILAMLAAVAASGWQTWTTRSRMDQVLIAATHCREVITRRVDAGNTDRAGPGSWGCEIPRPDALPLQPDVLGIGTDAQGQIGIRINTLALPIAFVGANSNYVYLTPLDSAGRPVPGGQAGAARIASWQCGSTDTALLRVLPVYCNTLYGSPPDVQTDAVTRL
jgi:type IV pilus assembly protein PilA